MSQPIRLFSQSYPRRRALRCEVLEARRLMHAGHEHDSEQVEVAVAALAGTPPATPVITEPLTNGLTLNPADVHMEAPVYFDADGDAHQSTDWEIWSLASNHRVWVTDAITGLERTHTHLGDGVFENELAGHTQLDYQTDYQLRVRFRDATGAVSNWATREFQTGAPATVFSLAMQDVASQPIPEWLDGESNPIDLPGGAQPASLRLETADAELMLALNGAAGANQIVNPAPLAAHGDARVKLSAGSSAVNVAASVLSFTDNSGATRSIYLPNISLQAGAQTIFWVAGDGSTYVGSAAQTEPDFSQLARASALPFVAIEPGYAIDEFASGFQLPVNIEFLPNPGPGANDPLFYVAELYGTIRVVTRGGAVSTYATGLLNFNPTGNFPGTGEQGLAGIVVEPATGDLIVSLLYSSNPADELAPHYPKIIRLHSTDGGRTAATQSTIIDMAGEEQGQSHQISHLSIGPDGKLYVHMGDGFDPSTSLNLNTMRGKILRMNLDGTAATDNPFYNATDGVTATDYIYAYGFRNPFGGAWRAADGKLYEVENGPTRDRLAQVVAGGNYGYNGTDESMLTDAIYNWSPAHAPVNLTFIQPGTFSGSLFPLDKQGHLFVTESGPTYATGPQMLGKRISEFVLDTAGDLVEGPTTLVEYNGVGKGTIVGLAAGPDGLYFTELYKDLGAGSPIEAGARIFRIRYRGQAEFSADAQTGVPTLTVHFTDTSDVLSPTGWLWDFGDGTTSTEPNPTHLYTQAGNFDVTLSVTSAAGIATIHKSDFIHVAAISSGLIAEYYNEKDLSQLALVRSDAAIDFDWSEGSPDASMASDTFSVRWTGQITPQFSQTYTFYARSDDGVRLWIDGQLIIDQWVNQAPTEVTGSIALVAGKSYSIRMEYFDDLLGAVAQLSWSSPSVAKQIVPASAFAPPNQSPTVIGVSVGRTNGPSYAVPAGGEQLRRVPLGGVNEVRLTFSEAMNVNASHLTLRGPGNVVIPLTGFATQPGAIAGTVVGIWKTNAPLGAGMYTLELADTIVDSLGKRLDGEWLNPPNLGGIGSNFPSGNGTAGGIFSFQFRLLPGDANGDHLVNGADYTSWADHFQQSNPPPSFGQGDFNGDGLVNGADYTLWADNFMPAASAVPLIEESVPVAAKAPEPSVLPTNSGGADTPASKPAAQNGLARAQLARAAFFAQWEQQAAGQRAWWSPINLIRWGSVVRNGKPASENERWSDG